MEPRIKQRVEWSIMAMVLCCSFMTYLLTYLLMFLLSFNSIRSFAFFWHCWLGVRKSTRPVKIEVLAWLPVWSEEQMISIWSNWCHFHPVISCLLTQVVLEKRLLNECLSFCRSVDWSGCIVLWCVISIALWPLPMTLKSIQLSETFLNLISKKYSTC